MGVYYFAEWLRRYVLSSKAPGFFREPVLRSGPLTHCNPLLIVKEHRYIIPWEQGFVNMLVALIG